MENVAEEDLIEEEVTVVKNRVHLKELFIGLSAGLFIGILAIVCIVFGVSEQLREYVLNSYKGSETVSELLNEVEVMYKAHYNKEIGEIDESKIVDAYIAEVGDKWGTYLTEQEVAEYLKLTNEAYCGIGIYTSKKNEVYKITRVGENTPASTAGILVGDIITEIDGYSIAELESTYGENRAMEEISGKKGTLVNITLNGNREITIARDDVYMSTVVSSNIAFSNAQYIKIYSFSDQTLADFKNCVDVNRKEYILDLRGNSGGDFSTAIQIVDTIAPSGLIVTEVDKNGSTVEYKSDVSSIDGKWVVLVDSNTASASELLAQSLKDFGIASVIGEHTVGKGTIFDQLVLSNGGYLFISSGEYHTSSGYAVEEKGVELDEEVNAESVIDLSVNSNGWDNITNKALEIIESK